MNLSILQKSLLFRDLSDEDVRAALAFFRAREQFYRKGDTLHRADEALPSFGLLLSGNVQVCTDDINGNQLMMASVTPGDTFGEALSSLRLKETGVYILAAQDSRVLWLSPEAVLSAPQSDVAAEFSRRFMALMATRMLSMNSRIQILSKRTLREKLIAFFSQEARRAGSSRFTVPFDRSGMAVYLGADRSALSRELSRMRQEGIIEYKRNEFRILIQE